MRSIKQLIRQPVKSLAGVLSIALAVAILCICLGQSAAASKSGELMGYHFITVAMPTMKYQVYEEQAIYADFKDHPIVRSNFAKSLPEAGVSTWLENTAQERGDLVKLLTSPGLASAYIPALTQDNLTGHKFFPWAFADKNMDARRMIPTPVYAKAMLEIVLEELEPPVAENFTPGVGGIVKLRGRVERVVSLEEGYGDPTGRYINVAFLLPNLESWEDLGVELGDRCLVYGGDYVDGNWALCGYITREMEEYLQGQGRFDKFEIKSLDEGDLYFYDEDERARLDADPSSKGVVARFDYTVAGYTKGFRFRKEQIDLQDAVNLTLVDKAMFGAGEEYRVPTIAKLEGSVEDFLSSEEGKPWREQLELLQVNYKAFPVIGVDRMGYIADFAKKSAGIIQGRDFTDQELESGAKVCIISEQSALLSGLTVGDALDMWFYNYDDNSPYQAKLEDGIGVVNPTAYTYTDKTPFAGEAEGYEIVGIYRQNNAWWDVADNIYSFTPNTVFTPKKSVPSDMAYGNQCFFQTVVLENGAVADFRTLAAGAGYPKLFQFYDGGYTEMAEGLFNYKEAAQRAAQLGVIIYGVLLALFLLLFPVGQQKTLATMRGLGAGRDREMAQVVVSCAGLMIPGTVIGVIVSSLLWKRVTQAFARDAEIAASMDLDLGVLAVIALIQLAVAVVLTTLLAVPLTRDKGISKESRRVPVRRKEPKRQHRVPLQAIGIFLFAVILSATLCYLRMASEAEVRRYNETYDKIPVSVSITDLSGTIDSALDINRIFVDAFLDETKLGKYLTDFQMVVQHNVTLTKTKAEEEKEKHMTVEEKAAAKAGRDCKLIGAHSTELLPELWEESGCVITWKEGYDESMFRSGEKICLIPEGVRTQFSTVTGEEIVVLECENPYAPYNPMDKTGKKTIQFPLVVVGTYAGSSKAIYCPFYAGRLLFQTLNEPLSCQTAHGVLKDNDDLETLGYMSWQWFAQPNALGEETPWSNGNGYETYPFALRINDTLLKQAAATMETSITTNRVCAVLVLCLSAGAGFLIGFLTVRSRKREIVLMRTMGTPNGRIYLGFALEQMLCIVLGVAIGGAFGRWQPADQLGALIGVYFIGLTMSLAVFLHTNLLASVKEEE